MNERFFDDLTRRVGDSALPVLPRRGLFGLLGGSALAGIAGLDLLTEDADARKKKKNKKKKNKNKKNKGKCKADGKKCKKSKDCCDSKCSDGRCGSRCPTRVAFNTRWGAFGGSDGQFRNPWDIAVSRDGEVFVTDTDNDRVQVFNESGTFIRAWNGSANDPRFEDPRGVGVNQDGGRARVTVSDPVTNNEFRRLRNFNVSGSNDFTMGRSQLQNPYGVATDSNNRIWVVDKSSTGRVFLYDSAGRYITNWTPSGNGALSNPHGIAVFKESAGTFVYVSDTDNNRVVKFEYTGDSASGLNFVKAAGSRGSGSSSFNGPAGIAADSCGNLWVADRNNNRIQILDKNLSFKSRFTASFSRPTGVAFGTNTKQLFVVDSSNAQVQKFSLSS